MFKLLMEFGPDVEIRNRQGLTALTLAAKFGKKEIFDYFLKIKRKTVWLYADIYCSAYPLKEIDTISEDGSIDPQSSLHLIVNGVY